LFGYIFLSTGSCSIEWPDLAAKARHLRKKPHTPDELIDEEDVASFTAFLRQRMAYCFNDAVVCGVSFKGLQEAVLAYLILFNRRRSGEMSRCPLTTYMDLRNDIWKNPSELASLSIEQQILAKSMHLCYIKGIVTNQQ